MMLKSFTKIVSQESELIWELFNSKTYKPFLIQDAFIVSWPKDQDEHLFTCHTSIITKEMLQKSINSSAGI